MNDAQLKIAKRVVALLDCLIHDKGITLSMPEEVRMRPCHRGAEPPTPYPYRHDLIPPNALLAIARLLCDGTDMSCKHVENELVGRWNLQSVGEHINYAQVHTAEALAAFINTDNTLAEKALASAAARILFALESFLRITKGEQNATG